MLAWHKARPRLAVTVHAAICLALLTFALISQYVFHLLPCVLCLWQRAPYALVTAIAIVSLMIERRWAPWILVSFAVLYVVEAGIAFFHVGVQAEWWAGTSGCGFHSNKGSDIADLYAQIKAAPITSCKDVTWKFLGFSMAFWNVIVASALAVFSAVQAWVQAPWWTATK